MKTVGIAVVLFTISAVFACNNQQSKKAEDGAIIAGKMPHEKSTMMKPDKTVEKDFKPCASIVTEILTTSPRYKQLTKGLSKAVVKNGGLSFGIRLEGCPNPRQNKVWSYSKTYDFTLYEMYPERQLNTTRFSFNPENKQLYEYDAVHDQLKPIAYDRNLLPKYETICQ
jgi:hypothetical protein